MKIKEKKNKKYKCFWLKNDIKSSNGRYEKQAGKVAKND